MNTSVSSKSQLTGYLEEISQHALLTRDEERQLGRRIQSGDDAARERMIESNLRLVVTIARDFSHRGLPIEDLIAEGNIGLMKAADRYDPENGAKFSTYATWWIKQHMRAAVQNQVRTVRVPTHIQGRAWNIEKASTQLECELGREPSDEELADATDLSVEQVVTVRRSLQPICHLEAPMAESETEWGEILADKNAECPDEIASRNDGIAQIRQLLGQLTEREERIIRTRFGIDQPDPATLSSVGETVGLTRERVRQIQNNALTKLRCAVDTNEVVPLTAA